MMPVLILLLPLLLVLLLVVVFPYERFGKKK